VTLPRAATPKLVLAVPSYNGRELLEQMLPSVARQRFRDFRVVIVDDGSTDDTVAWLHTTWPYVDVVALERNVGVTAAFNACLRAAGDAELVALFNNDMELAPDCLGELVRAMGEHPEAGSATAKLVDYHRRELLDGAGDAFRWTATALRRGHGQPDDGRFALPEAVFGACGGAAVYRRGALDDVGWFDESFFAFSEDVDWALRAQLAGWTCRYVPSAVAFHMGSATLGSGLTDFTAYHLWRNAVWLVAKNYPGAALVRHAPQIAFGIARNLAAACWGGKLRVWLRAMRDALRGLPAVVRRRRSVPRRRSLAELERVMGW
jgi:GT2 family glycosyltransferase